MKPNPLATIVLAAALAAAPVAVAGSAPPAPTKLKDVLAPFKGKQISVTVTGAKADEAKQRKLLAVGDDFIAFELANGNRTYFVLTRISSIVISDDQLTITLKD